MPEGVRAVQARIAVLQSTFVAPARGGQLGAGAVVDPSIAAAFEGIGSPSTGPAPTSFANTLAGVLADREHAAGAGPITKGGHGHDHDAAVASVGELKRFGNGRIPPAALVTIGPGHKLAAPAAESFTDMVAAAKRDGVTLRITDSYRDFHAQEDVARRKGLYKNGGLAAVPGTSTHGWGISIDVDTKGGALEWLRRNGARYGFVEDVPREPWHWTWAAGKR